MYRHLSKNVYLILIFVSLYSSSALAQMPEPAAVCVDCGRSESYIQKYGHAPTCKYYNPPKNKTSEKKSSDKTTSSLYPNSNSLDKAINNGIDFMNSLDHKPDLQITEEEKKQEEIRKRDEEARLNSAMNSMKSIPNAIQKNTNSMIMNEFVGEGDFGFYHKNGQKISSDNNKVILENGSQIITGKNGNLKLTLSDTTVFSIGPYSDLKFDEFKYDQHGTLTKFTVNLTKGILKWVTKSITEKGVDEKHLRLLICDLEINGADFLTKQNADSSAVVILIRGEINLITFGFKEQIILNPGNKVAISSVGKIESVEKIDIKNSPSLSDLD
jgi:hypothetical protein